jgi:hypothetical protein
MKRTFRLWQTTIAGAVLAFASLGAQAQFAPPYGGYGGFGSIGPRWNGGGYFPQGGYFNQGGYLMSQPVFGSGLILNPALGGFGPAFAITPGLGGYGIHTFGGPIIASGPGGLLWQGQIPQGYAPTLNLEQDARPQTNAGEAARTPDTDSKPADSKTESAREEALEVIREPNYKVRFNWKGEFKVLRKITFQLLDRTKKMLREEQVTEEPATARLLKPYGTAYYRVILNYQDGKTHTITGPL